MLKMPPEVHFWCEREEEYLELLHKTCLELSEVYRRLYVSTIKIQNKLRLPSIIMSSLSGAASFGSSSFAAWSNNPQQTQKYINVSIGIVNVFIAMLQTYETFRKIGDTVSNSISTSISLKKLAEDIHCMIFIPAGDRDTAGITYLKDAFNKYQSIMEKAPPLEIATKDYLRFEDVSSKIKVKIKHDKNEKNNKNKSDKNDKNNNVNTDLKQTQSFIPFASTITSVANPSPLYIPNRSEIYMRSPTRIIPSVEAITPIHERSDSMDSYTSTQYRDKKKYSSTEDDGVTNITNLDDMA